MTSLSPHIYRALADERLTDMHRAERRRRRPDRRERKGLPRDRREGR